MVIILMQNWNLHEMLNRNTGVIADFLKSGECSKRGEGKLDRTLDHLVKQEKTEWSRPKASPLSGNIYVIRFSDENKKQLRVFGHFDDDRHCFVMTLTGFEKDDRYHPGNYLERAIGNKVETKTDFFRKTISYNKKCVHAECAC